MLNNTSSKIIFNKRYLLKEKSTLTFRLQLITGYIQILIKIQFLFKSDVLILELNVYLGKKHVISQWNIITFITDTVSNSDHEK